MNDTAGPTIESTVRAKRLGRQADGRYRWKTSYRAATCVVCGAEFQAAVRNPTLTCSKPCAKQRRIASCQAKCGPDHIRFWRRVEKTDGCWIWTGGMTTSGYGAFKKGYAHRFSLELRIGRVLSRKEFACHRCDNPRCVNPDHLFVGSALDNTRDMFAKGRDASGERKGTAKLKEADVLAIRSAAASGETHESIAARYVVCRRHISAIVSRRFWRHI
jgi:hypothetical protein